MGCRIGCRKVHSLLLVHIYYLTTASLMVFLQVYLSDLPLFIALSVGKIFPSEVMGLFPTLRPGKVLLLRAGTSSGRQC